MQSLLNTAPFLVHHIAALDEATALELLADAREFWEGLHPEDDIPEHVRRERTVGFLAAEFGLPPEEATIACHVTPEEADFFEMCVASTQLRTAQPAEQFIP